MDPATRELVLLVDGQPVAFAAGCVLTLTRDGQSFRLAAAVDGRPLCGGVSLTLLYDGSIHTPESPRDPP